MATDQRFPSNSALALAFGADAGRRRANLARRNGHERHRIARAVLDFDSLERAGLVSRARVQAADVDVRSIIIARMKVLHVAPAAVEGCLVLVGPVARVKRHSTLSSRNWLDSPFSAVAARSPGARPQAARRR